MGKIPRPSPTADADAARTLTADLHAAIKDGRQLLAELRRERAAIGGNAASAAAQAAGEAARQAMSEVEASISSRALTLAGLIQAASENISAQVHALAGCTTPERFVDLVAGKLTAIIRPTVTGIVEEHLAELMVQVEAERARA